jgi:hypothetical protein
MEVALTSTAPTTVDEATAWKVAREIAVGLETVETILETHKVTAEAWAKLQASPLFQRLLQEQVEAWSSALNTNERARLKAAAMVEYWLKEANARAHDPKEALSSKVELMKWVKTVAGMGVPGAGGEGGGGDRFSVVINLGADQSLKFTKEATPKTIEGELVGSS